jgi:hypothetical protein
LRNRLKEVDWRQMAEWLAVVNPIMNFQFPLVKVILTTRELKAPGVTLIKCIFVF